MFHRIFFYGDCAPSMPMRPNRNVSHEDIFRALLLREELEYHLQTDILMHLIKGMASHDLILQSLVVSSVTMCVE